MTRLCDLQVAVAIFRDQRGWIKYHTPRNLMASICIEAAELLETMQWDDGNADNPIFQRCGDEQKTRVAMEMADVAIYLLSLADVMDIDLDQAILKKIAINEERFPC